MGACIRILCLLLAHSSVTSAPIYLEMVPPTMEEIAFMKQYGYLSAGEDVDGSSAYTPQSLAGAVAKLQAFAGLPPTGDLDDETRSLFRKRRCGIKDIETPAVSMRKRRYILQQGWRKRDISYKISNGSSSLGKSRIEELMATALEVWAPHGGLRFTKTDASDADIQVSFASQDHGDGFPFDGPGHVVAHAFGPPYGEMHFDDDEYWTDDPEDANEDATEFFAVAVHEIGHALGLCHSNVKTSVMYPYYQVPVERLNSDDILGMHELYLKDQLPEPQSTEGPGASVPRFTKADSEELDEDDDVPDLCYANYDTIQVLQGKIYVFEEEWMWVLSGRRQVAPGYPRRFHDVFEGLPEEVRVIRTLYEKRNGNIAVFQGDEYWEFDPGFKLVKRGSISDYQLPAHVAELQTVFVSDYNNKTYLIEYERFWRYDEAAAAMDRGYPKEMAAWRKLPYPVDAALVWRGDTYFFRGPRFWRFDNARIEAHDYYPLPTAQVWFPCGASQDMDTYVANERP